MDITFILFILAAICFILATFGVAVRINLIAFGLFLLTVGLMLGAR